MESALPSDVLDLPMISRKKLFLSYFSIGLALLVIIFLAYGIIERTRLINEHKLRSQTQLDYQAALFVSRFESIRSDLLFLPQLNEFFRYMEISKDQDRKFIEKEFLQFTKSKLMYDQIRYIDHAGQEIVRINFNKGHPTVVAEENLQNKKDRYYFEESVHLNEGELYISPFDLNKEQGRVETPLKPMIRFGTPVFNSVNENRGIVILNFLGDSIIDDLKSASRNYAGTFSLIDTSGYWLFNDNPEEEWGFMFSNREHLTYKICFPEIWKKISTTSQTQMKTKNSLITSEIVTPFSELENGKLKRSWILTNTISYEEMGIQWKQIYSHIFIIFIFLLPLNGILSFYLSRAMDEKNKYHIALTRSALYDTLTGLPNRKLLEERVEQTMQQAKRYSRKYALLFIDLDGFKSVNDNLGHDAGDQLLQQVSERLTRVVRSTDTVSRFGGDEFIILLGEIESSGNVEMISDKILKAISKEFTLKQGLARISACIGIVTGDPDNSASFEEMLRKADGAMYTVKTSGKNGFSIA